MVRISDILKQRGQGLRADKPQKEKEEEKPQLPKEEPREYGETAKEKTNEGIQMTKAMAGEQDEAEKEMQLVKAMHQQQLSPDESEKIYNQALNIIKEILSKVESDVLVDLKEASEIVKVIVDRIVLGDKELIALTVNYSEDNYLYAHSVNNCILSIDMGLGLGYNKSKLNELGLGAFLHDLSMIKFMDIANKPDKINKDEYNQIKKHPIDNIDILTKIKNIQTEVAYIVKQAHERINGSGYPVGLKGEQLHEYSQIVGLIDVYEALTHPRTYRQALEPYEAIKNLLSMNSTGLFKTQLLKLLINRLGFYPVGSWVELNTGEIAKVVSSRNDYPLRPKVNVIFSARKERLEQIKLIDLFTHTNVFIKRSINPRESDFEIK